MQQFTLILRLSKPLYVLFAGLTYSLGAGIALYLGVNLDVPVFLLGLGGISLMQFSMSLMAEGLRPVGQPSDKGENRTERVNLRKAALLISFGGLAAAAIIAILLGQLEKLIPIVMLFLGLSLLAVLAYAVPPLRVVDIGFGEFIHAVHIAVISLALGFALQHGDYHRLAAIVSFPLTLLAIACFLVLSFPTFANDEKYDRQTLLRSIGWERAVSLHHSLILGAYSLLGGALFFGIAWALIWPSLLTIPFGLLQIFWLRNISNGARPIWNILTINAMAIFGLTTYLLTFAFWLR